MKEFDIWMEGYRATEQYSPAQKIGEGVGETFDDAVRDYMSKNENHHIEVNSPERYVSEDAYENRRSNWNIWACSLFDNEEDARKSYG